MSGGMGAGRRGPSLAQRSEQVLQRQQPPPRQRAEQAPGMPDGEVGYQNPRSEGPGHGVPVTLTVEQLGGEPVHRGARAVAVFAWVPWTDGRYRAVVAFAYEWTSSAVHLRWRESAGGLRDAWVWSAGVRRRNPDGS